MSNVTSETVIESRAVNCFGLFCSGSFDVPWHQRRYDWTPQHVDELLQDLDEAVTENRHCYFLGTIILVATGSARWRINDGQQRIVTLSLIAARLLRSFAERGESSYQHRALRILFDIDENSTAGYRDADRLTPRVTPPREDKTRFNLLIRGRNIGENGKLLQAWRQIDAFVLGMGVDKSKKFFDFIIRKLEVSRLDIPASVDPNSVYETINNRGKQLDDLDLIRNHLYSYFNEEGESSRRATVHGNLEHVYTQLRDGQKFTDYARCYFQCAFGFLKKSSFYREARRHLQSQSRGSVDGGLSPADYIYDFVEKFSDKKTVEIFRTVASPNRDSGFVEQLVSASGHANARRNIGTFLRELKAYTITQPLSFALLFRYDAEQEAKRRRRLARWVHARLNNITSFVMRTAFVAPKFEPSRFESEFADLAARLMTMTDVDTVDVDAGLRECDGTWGVIDDEKFTGQLHGTEMRDAKKIKKFLFGVNSGVQSDAEIVNEHRCSIEHILPKGPNHWPTWTGFDSRPEEWVHRIGNLTLLGRSDNKPGEKDNRSFAAKKRGFAGSAVHITRELADCEDWSPERIMERQRRLVTQAAHIWSFNWK